MKLSRNPFVRALALAQSATSNFPADTIWKLVSARHSSFRLGSLISLSALTLLVSHSAEAATLYWDLNGTTANTGTSASGTWDGTLVRWNTASSGTGGTAQAGTTNADDLIFSSGTGYTSGGTITLAGARVASSITLEENEIYSLTGGTSLTLGGSGASSGIFLLAAADQNVGISTAIILNGNNTFETAGTGVLTISGGVTGTGSLILNNNSTNANGITISTVSLNNTGTVTNSGSGSGDVTISSVIGTNVTGVIQNSASSGLTLSGANLYTGLTDVQAGTLTLGANNIFADASTIKVSGGILSQNTRTDTVAGVQLTAGSITGTTGVLTSTTDFDLQAGNVSAILGGSVGANKTTAGTVILSGTNTYTGATAIVDGVLNIQNASALGTIAGATTVSSGAALQIQGGITTLAEGLTLNGTGIAADGALRNISGTNTYAGAITLGSATRINSDAGTLTLNVASGNAIAGTNVDVTFGGAGNVTVSDAIATGTGALSKDGAGTLTLSATNTYTGLTDVQAGTLALGASNVFDNASTLKVSGGILSLVANSDTVAGVQLTAGSITGTTGVLTSTTAFDLQAGSASAILGGAIGANKTTAGTVTLSGANTYTGATSISNGTLSAGNIVVSGGNSHLGNASSAVVLGDGTNTGTLNYTGSATTFLRGFSVTAGGGGGKLTNTTANLLQMSTGGTAVGSGSTMTFGATAAGGITVNSTSVISGVGNVVVNSSGAGVVTFSATNTYTGLTDVQAGTLALGASNVFDNASTLKVSGGILSLVANSDTVAGVQLTAGSITGTTGVLTSTTAFDLQAGSASAILGGAIGANKTTAGTVTLSGANTYTGATSISNGTLSAGNIVVSGGNSHLGNASSAVVLGDGTNTGTLNYTGSAATFLRGFSVTAGGGGGKLTNTTANLLQMSTGGTAVGSGSTMTFGATAAGGITVNSTSVISGVGNVVVNSSGAGVVTFSATNTYTGLTDVQAGTLALGASNVFDNASTLKVSGGILSLVANSDTVAGVQLTAGSITGTTGVLTSTTAFDLQAGSVGAILGGSAGATKTAVGTVTLSGVNTYTGLTDVQAGTLTLGATNVFANASTLKVSGGILSMLTFADTVAGVQLTAGSITGTTGVLTSTTAFDLQAGSISADLGGSAGATKTTAGTVTLSGTNTYTGLTDVQAGTLTLGASDVFANASTLKVSGGTLSMLTFADTVAGVQLTAGSITGSTGVLTSTTAFDLQAGSVGAILGGTTGANKTTAGTVTLSAANSYTGLTTVSAGTLEYGVTNALSSGAVTVSGGTLDIKTFNDSVGAVTLSSGSIIGTSGILTGTSYALTNTGSVSAILAGAVNLTKTGAGTATISGNNTYTGVTSVDVGTLRATTSANALGTGAATLDMGGGTLELANNTGLAFNRNTTISASSTIKSDVLTPTGAGVTHTLGTLTFSSAQTLTIGAGGNVGSGTAGIAFGNVTIDAGSPTFSVGSGSLLTMAAIDSGSTADRTITFGGDGNTTVSGIIDDATGGGNTTFVTKNGTGTLTLATANTYTDVTTISGGDVKVQNNTSLGTTAAGTTVASGAAIQIDGSGLNVAEAITSLNGDGGGTGALQNLANSNTWSGAITLGSASRINSDSGTFTINSAGSITGNFGLTLGGAGNIILSDAFAPVTTAQTLTKDGAGTVTLNVANTHTGLTTISAGTLTYGASNILSTGAVTVNGSTAILNLGASQSDSVGTVTLAGGGQIIGTGTSTLTSTGTFEMHSGSVSAILAGTSIPLNKTTSGTATLSGANTYTGLTTVTTGTLLANNASGSATGTGAVSVTTTGAILGGSGTITPGAANGISVTGVLAPGASVGTIGNLTLDLGSTTGTVVMNSGASFQYDLGVAGIDINTVGTSDLLTLAGAAASNFAFASNTIDFLGSGGIGYYKLFDTSFNATTWTGLTVGGTGLITAGLNISNLTSGLTGNLIMGGNSLGGTAGDIYLQVIPEPSAALLAGIGSLLLLRRRRVA